VGRPDITGLHQGPAHSHWAYVMSVRWTAGDRDCKVGDYIMMGIFMVTMMGSDMKGTGWVLSFSQSCAAEIQPGKHPNCVWGENRSGKYAIVVNCCAELKSCSMHMLKCWTISPHGSPHMGIARMNSETSLFPPKLIICTCLIMACCVLPNTLKNYAAQLDMFYKFCDDFKVPEADCMPPSESLLLMFVTIYGVGMVGKGAIKTWSFGIRSMMHHGLGGTILQWVVKDLLGWPLGHPTWLNMTCDN